MPKPRPQPKPTAEQRAKLYVAQTAVQHQLGGAYPERPSAKNLLQYAFQVLALRHQDELTALARAAELGPVPIEIPVEVVAQ